LKWRNMPKRHFMKSRWESVNEPAEEFVDGTSPAELNAANGNAQSKIASRMKPALRREVMS
jgi:hypothetical protein